MSPFGNLVFAFAIILSYLFLGNKAELLIFLLCFLSILITVCSYSERIKLKFIELESLTEASLENNRQLVVMIKSISEARNVYSPRILISKSLLPEDAVSLYTIGRSRDKIFKDFKIPKHNGILVVHQNVINILDEIELFHVIAHEMSHLIFGDSIRFATSSILSILFSGISCLIILRTETLSPSILGFIFLLIIVILSFAGQRNFFFSLEFAADRNALHLVSEAEKIYEEKMINNQI